MPILKNFGSFTRCRLSCLAKTGTESPFYDSRLVVAPVEVFVSLLCLRFEVEIATGAVSVVGTMSARPSQMLLPGNFGNCMGTTEQQ